MNNLGKAITEAKSVVTNEQVYSFLAPEVSDALDRSLGLVKRTANGISEEAFVDLIKLMQEKAGRRATHAIMAEFVELVDPDGSGYRKTW